eukprot:362913-Chlamydomonas_euryale.AAC.1
MEWGRGKERWVICMRRGGAAGGFSRVQLAAEQCGRPWTRPAAGCSLQWLGPCCGQMTGNASREAAAPELATQQVLVLVMCELEGLEGEWS